MVDQGEVASIFLSKKDRRRVKISLRQDKLEEISSVQRGDMEELARKLYSLDDEELFEIEV